jgi:hypothetical protein
MVRSQRYRRPSLRRRGPGADETSKEIITEKQDKT